DAGQPGAGADVRDALPAQQGREREALDEVPLDELVRVADARQVIRAVPFDEQLKVRRERRGDLGRDRVSGGAERRADRLGFEPRVLHRGEVWCEKWCQTPFFARTAPLPSARARKRVSDTIFRGRQIRTRIRPTTFPSSSSPHAPGSSSSETSRATIRSRSDGCHSAPSRRHSDARSAGSTWTEFTPIRLTPRRM